MNMQGVAVVNELLNGRAVLSDVVAAAVASGVAVDARAADAVVRRMIDARYIVEARRAENIGGDADAGGGGSAGGAGGDADEASTPTQHTLGIARFHQDWRDAAIVRFVREKVRVRTPAACHHPFVPAPVSCPFVPAPP
jgi:hypothetical protein